ncbi:MAG: hypothetical protein MJ252_30825 [archaeon]|nr:hypothetical protein [archaeon]
MKNKIIPIVFFGLIQIVFLDSITFPFQTHKYNLNLIPKKNLTEYMSVKRIHTQIDMGTPYQRIRLNIEMNTPYLSIISQRFSDDPSCIPYSKEESMSYLYLNETDTISLDRYLTNEGFEGKYDVDISAETIKFGDKAIAKMRFFLVTKDHHQNMFTINSGIMGLDLNRVNNKNAQYYKFVRRLSEFHGIDNYNFYLDFSKDSDDGKLVLGAMPNETNTLLNDYISNIIYADYQSTVNGLRWGISFRHLNMSSEDKFIHYTNQYALNFTFSTSNDSIVLHKKFLNLEIFDFLRNYVSEGLCDMEQIFNNSYTTFNCINDKKRINFKKFPTFTFYHPEINETFYFNFEDLSEVYLDRIYYKVHFYSQDLSSDVRDVFGRPFFKKYGNRLSFNWDKYTLTFFTDKLINPPVIVPKRKGMTAAIIIIIILVIFLGGLGFFIYRKRHLLMQRKRRAKELDDEFLYMPDINK